MFISNFFGLRSITLLCHQSPLCLAIVNNYEPHDFTASILHPYQTLDIEVINLSLIISKMNIVQTACVDNDLTWFHMLRLFQNLQAYYIYFDWNYIYIYYMNDQSIWAMWVYFSETLWKIIVHLVNIACFISLADWIVVASVSRQFACYKYGFYGTRRRALKFPPHAKGSPLVKLYILIFNSKVWQFGCKIRETSTTCAVEVCLKLSNSTEVDRLVSGFVETGGIVLV